MNPAEASFTDAPDRGVHLARRRLAFAVTGIGLLGWGLGGCASRAPAPQRPFQLAAVLPPVYATPRKRDLVGAGGVAFGAVGAMVAASIEAERRDAAANLRRTLLQIGFDPEVVIRDQLLASLMEKNVSSIKTEVAGAAYFARTGRLGELETGVDLAVEVVIESATFVDAGAGGWSPELNFMTRLYTPNPDRDGVEECTYYADWRGSHKDRRWLKTPTTLVFPTVAAIEAKPAQTMQQINALVKGLTDLMADDLSRRAQGLPFLD